jgi:glycosyltransferase involved in cell wall biosynthesis
MTDKGSSDSSDIGERLKRLELDHAAQGERLEHLEELVRDRMSRSLRGALSPQLWNFRQHVPRLLNLPESYAAATTPENAPRIAIVTPHFKQEHFLKATIESVLSQGYSNLAYCVQDAGSGEETRALLESYSDRLLWYSEPDSGQAQAINRGFQHVSGDLMAYLNSDDMLLPGTLEYVARAFQSNPEIDLVYGHRIYVDSRGLEIGRAVLPPHDPETLKWMDYIPQETLFWRRSVWDAVGPMDESFRFALDWNFIARAIQAGFRFKRRLATSAASASTDKRRSRSSTSATRRWVASASGPSAGGPSGTRWIARYARTFADRGYSIGCIRSAYFAIDRPASIFTNSSHSQASGRYPVVRNRSD